MNPTPAEPEVRPALRCPRCDGRDIVPSLPRGFFDNLLVKRWKRVPRHCRYCGKRFWVPSAAPAVR